LEHLRVYRKVILEWIFRNLMPGGVERINLDFDRDKKWTAVDTVVKLRVCF